MTWKWRKKLRVKSRVVLKSLTPCLIFLEIVNFFQIQKGNLLEKYVICVDSYARFQIKLWYVFIGSINSLKYLFRWNNEKIQRKMFINILKAIFTSMHEPSSKTMVNFSIRFTVKKKKNVFLNISHQLHNSQYLTLGFIVDRIL